MLSYLELVLHVSVKFRYKILLSHAEQCVLVLLWKVVPVLSQRLKAIVKGDCQHCQLRQGSSSSTSSHLYGYWTGMQVTHGQARFLLPSTATDVPCHELQLALTLAQFGLCEGRERLTKRDMLFQRQGSRV